MPHFEVHTLADDRWLIDGIFFDKATAIDEAKQLLSQTRALDAVRVLQVEEEENEFYEWTVYLATQPRPLRHRRKRGAVSRPEPASEAAPPAAVLAPRPRARARSQSAAPALLVGVLALCGLFILFAHRPKQPEWLFDRPEAWQPHTVSNPWTGEVSR